MITIIVITFVFLVLWVLIKAEEAGNNDAPLTPPPRPKNAVRRRRPHQSAGEDAVTRDEARAKCLEAMETAWIKSGANNLKVADAMAAAFDALNGIARVDPIEATEEMIDAGLYYAQLVEIWRAMSAAGDLTNGPENKP